MRAATFSLACRRALSPSPTGWKRAAAAPGTRRRPARGLTAAAAAEQSGGAAAAPTPTPKQQHAALQADYFDREIKALQESITPEVDAKLARIAAAIPGLSAASRVLDAGAGEGALIPHLQVRLASCVQWSYSMSKRAATTFCVPGKCTASNSGKMGAEQPSQGLTPRSVPLACPAAACPLLAHPAVLHTLRRRAGCKTSWQWTSPQP